MTTNEDSQVLQELDVEQRCTDCGLLWADGQHLPNQYDAAWHPFKSVTVERQPATQEDAEVVLAAARSRAYQVTAPGRWPEGKAAVDALIEASAAVSAAKVEALLTALREIDGLMARRMDETHTANAALDIAHAALIAFVGRSA